MIDEGKLNEAIIGYKQFLPKHWPEERFKWEAVKNFQDVWDPDANDFAKMLEQALSKTENLLTSQKYFPARMIVKFAEAYPDRVREMFNVLFGSKPLSERLAFFKNEAVKIKELPEFSAANQHYQDGRAMTAYLWLRFPDENYLYQYSLSRDVALKLDSSFVPQKGQETSNIEGSQELFDLVRSSLLDDPEIKALLGELIDEKCYPDPLMITTAIDFGHYLWKHVESDSSQQHAWWPNEKDYSPGISAQEWQGLLQDQSIFNSPDCFVVLGCFLDFGGEATCSQLAEKYGRNYGWYNAKASALAERVAKATGCPHAIGSDGKARWWPILFQGKNAENSQPGSFVWKLRPELSEALEALDWSTHELHEQAGCRHWWVNANAKFWSWDSIPIGGTIEFTSLNDNGNKRAKYKYFLEAKAGDLIIGYQTTPQKTVSCLCEVLGELTEDGCLPIRKTAVATKEATYEAIKSHSGLKDMEYLNSAQGTIFSMTKDEFDIVSNMAQFSCEDSQLAFDFKPTPYDKGSFLDEVFMSESDYDALVALIKRKKNIILKGAPGTGKTFAAKRLAWSIMGEKDESRIETVQFHQSYSYEDFVIGYRPNSSGSFDARRGAFLDFCEKARKDPSEREYFLIIDEINRANVSRVFGELLMLIEKDHRGEEITLGINNIRASVPKNLHIIGMMNTADRSLALIDYALRRRFSFFTMKPALTSSGFKTHCEKIGSPRFDELVRAVGELNEKIRSDRSLGEGFEIGHSYLCIDPDSDVDVAIDSVVEFDLVPLLEEYWFDDAAAANEAKSMIRGAIA